MSRNHTRAFLTAVLSALFTFATGCGSANYSPTLPGGGSGPAPTGANVVAISVNTGPTVPAGDGPYVNGAFTSVTICTPGSATQCQTIGGILIDTGSYGLRILSSALTVPLTQQVDSSNNPIYECAPFASGVTWGAIQTTDFTISGETAASLPIQVIGTQTEPTPIACANQGSPTEDLSTLGANGILGIGIYSQDCGAGCTSTAPSNLGYYYTCPAQGCQVTTLAVGSQVTNPVVLFATDNNGSIIELPSVSGAAVSVSGYLVFGIGTESNNGLGSAAVYDIDPSTANFTTVFDSTSFTDAAFIDSGSNALYFDPLSTGLASETCTDLPFWYCPNSNVAFSATNEGFSNGNSGPVNFTVGNADSLVGNSADGVANGLAGPFPGFFDWGLPFFYGLNVYTAIQGKNTPAGVGPYWAY